MSTIMTVTLTTVDGNKVLHIDDHKGGNHRGMSPHTQTFVWQLFGNLMHGQFQPIDAAPPGFAWLVEPPPGVFGVPLINDGGRRLQLPDNHTGASTNGEWAYQIAVRLGDMVYLSERTKLGDTIKDPVIINK